MSGLKAKLIIPDANKGVETVHLFHDTPGPWDITDNNIARLVNPHRVHQ